MNSNIRLSENISELRRKKNITQEELAEFMGVTKASVSKWERGSRLSAAGGTDVCELLKTDVILHVDAFFTRLDEWFDGLELGAQGVRDRRLIVESAKEVFAYPQLAALPDQERLQKMKQRIS